MRIKRVLMQHVSSHGQQIRLRTANLVLRVDAQHAQENFLGEIGDVGRIAQASGQKAAQPLAVPFGKICYEALAFVTMQGAARGRVLRLDAPFQQYKSRKVEIRATCFLFGSY